MSRFVSVASNFTSHPILHLDAQAPMADLLVFTDVRMRAANNMLKSLACLNAHATEDSDLSHFALAAYLLLEPGCAALNILDQRSHAGEALC